MENRLGGRWGRQGDPGETQFFVSLEDSLMRIFASDVIKRVMGTFKIPEDEPIYNSMITRSLEKAQTRIEELNFDARKHVLAYDDILNAQRQAVYGRRRALLTGGSEAAEKELARLSEGNLKFAADIARKKAEIGESPAGGFPALARRFLLQTVDFLWVEHLEAMEYLRSSVNLRAYGQRDPLVEYKKEGLRLFQNMEATYALQVEHALPNLGAPTPHVTRDVASSAVIHRAARSITEGVGNTRPRVFGRNDKVIITD